jgi:methyl-accepting chemotaxis protein
MGLGSTAKKLQKVADTAEELYRRINDLKEQMRQTQETVNETSARVDDLEREVREQRAILERLAENDGIDVDAVTADVHINDAETDDDAVEADAETQSDA